MTTDKMIAIMVEEMNGKKPSVEGKEADVFRADFRRDMERAKKEGWIIDIPSEWEVE